MRGFKKYYTRRKERKDLSYPCTEYIEISINLDLVTSLVARIEECPEPFESGYWIEIGCLGGGKQSFFFTTEKDMEKVYIELQKDLGIINE